MGLFALPGGHRAHDHRRRLAVGARDRSVGPDWGSYTVDERAIRHGAGVETETTDPDVAYERFEPGGLVRYVEGSLPDL